MILNAAKTTFSHNKSPNPVALYDLGASAATLCYQAIALGLFTHQMAGYDRDVARKLFDVPDDYISARHGPGIPGRAVGTIQRTVQVTGDRPTAEKAIG